MKFELGHRLVGYAVFLLLFILFSPIFLHHSHPVNKPIKSNVSPVMAASAVTKRTNPADQTTSIHFKINSVQGNAKPRGGNTSSMMAAVSSYAQKTIKNSSKTTKVPSKKLSIIKQDKQRLALLPVNNKKGRSQQRVAQGQWLVQLGTFSHVKNANRLLQALKEKGYNGFTSRTKLKNGRYFTLVFVGPETQRSSATKLQKLILKQMRLKGVIKYSKS